MSPVLISLAASLTLDESNMSGGETADYLYRVLNKSMVYGFDLDSQMFRLPVTYRVAEEANLMLNAKAKAELNNLVREVGFLTVGEPRINLPLGGARVRWIPEEIKSKIFRFEVLLYSRHVRWHASIGDRILVSWTDNDLSESIETTSLVRMDKHTVIFDYFPQ
ncbi:MAG: hypothetical protein ACK4E0_06810 [Chitinophagaceae bacterium]|jgi:hypothetical protein